jgi:hypothetical protein
MELANCRLHIGNDSDVPQRSITPAEAMVLVTLHKDRAKKHPLLDLKVIGSAQSIKTPAEVQETDGSYDKDITVPVADGTRTIKKGETVLAGTLLKSAEYRPRTGHEEISRLRTKYHKKTIDETFPKNSKVPETFAEAAETWKEIPKVADEGVVGSWTDVPGALPLQKTESPVVTPLAPPKP